MYYWTGRDLRQNRIVTLAATGPWPQNAVLQTLLLDENPLAAVDAAALAPLRSLQFLYVTGAERRV